MKKSLKELKLNKQVISTLALKEVEGGRGITCGQAQTCNAHMDMQLFCAS